MRRSTADAPQRLPGWFEIEATLLGIVMLHGFISSSRSAALTVAAWL